jgi:FMN-dependent NADH-azoreductase
MEQTYTSEEIKQLILYAQEMQQVNEDLRAGIIAMQAKLNNEEAKVKRLTMLISQFTNVN